MENKNNVESSVNKSSMAEQIYEIIKTRIIDLEFHPGEKIDIDDLSQEFQVSRAPIRDALQRLVDKGLVEVKPRVGYFVVQLTEEEVEDIYSMRKLFECYALEESLDKISHSRLEELKEEALELRSHDIPKAELRERFDRTDELLHKELIVKHADNEILHDFYERISNLIGFTRHLNRRILTSNEEHLNIINALLEKDRGQAEEKLRQHLNNVLDEILNSSEKTGDNA